ncbi:hypothetical protein GCM10020295_82970 [Streptomyces cinereospinus]
MARGGCGGVLLGKGAVADLSRGAGPCPAAAGRAVDVADDQVAGADVLGERGPDQAGVQVGGERAHLRVLDHDVPELDGGAKGGMTSPAVRFG